MDCLNDYKAIIVDLDGTLYYQKPVHFAMIREMIVHFWRLHDFVIIYKYRRLYERGYSESERIASLPTDCSNVIHKWMVSIPRQYISRYRDDALIYLLQKVIRQGVPVIVLSDYPVEDKLQALEFAPNYAFSANDTGCLKPKPDGIRKILSSMGIAPKECLVIGDRPEKDGLLAQNLGADALILPTKRSERLLIYRLFR